VLDAAGDRRPAGRPHPPVDPVDPLTSFRRRIAALREVLGSAPAGGWDRRAAPYEWTVHGLVGHLVGVERYLGGLLGLWPFDPVGPEHDHLGVTEPFVARTGGADPRVTVAEWTGLAATVADHAERLGAGGREATIAFHGLAFTIDDVLALRAFEVWTHAEDVRRALRLDLAPGLPEPGELRTMADLSLRHLFPATLLTAPHQSSRSARFVLTGPGGGVWRLGAAAGAPDVRVVADVVDYCHMAARRMAPGDLAADVSGDEDLALDLLAAAQLLAA
jgi:uncharacterized protein (TIGR03083 family)